MTETIQNKLAEIEEKYQIRILYACESGSRAWGFPSTDSDYDVRFIYQCTKNTYISINEAKDVLDFPINDVLDINGWDVRKALRLFCSSNAALYEWLQSPIVYKQNDAFKTKVNVLMSDYFSCRKGMHHYLGMAKNAYSELQSKEVRLKKYFYCLRPLLAAQWIVEKQEVPPMEFSVLRQLISNQTWQNEVDKLLQIKAQADEKTTITPSPVLQTFIEEQLPALEKAASNFDIKEIDTEPVNALFRNLLNEF